MYTSPSVTTFNAKLTVTNAQSASSSRNRGDHGRQRSRRPDHHGARRRAPASCPGRPSPSRAPPPIRTTAPLPASALSWTVLLHHNTHVHTFVGGTGSQGSFVAENHGPIGTFSYEIILTATDSSG